MVGSSEATQTFHVMTVSFLKGSCCPIPSFSIENCLQVDLPTIIESQKTIDRKTFYKTADICQLLICKEGEPSEDEEEPPEKVFKQTFYFENYFNFKTLLTLIQFLHYFLIHMPSFTLK